MNDKENDVSDLNAVNGKVNWERLVYGFEMPLGLGWYGPWFVAMRVRAEGVAYSVHLGRGLECGR